MSTSCDFCYKKIDGPVVRAMSKSFHEACFTCNGCKKQLSSTRYKEHKNKPLCTHCYDHICKACRKVITERRFVNFRDEKYHSSCFKCATCGSVLGFEFQVLDDKPYCDKDYELELKLSKRKTGDKSKSSSTSSPTISRYSSSSTASSTSSPPPTRYTSSSSSTSSASSASSSASGSKCENCRKVIDGPAMVVERRKWHPECFKCGACHKKIPKGVSFFEDDDVEGNIMCENCNEERCQKCGKVLLEEFVNFEGKKFHEGCFCCTTCRCRLNLDQFFKINGKPYCKSDYQELRNADS